MRKRILIACLLMLVSVGPTPRADIYVCQESVGIFQFTNAPYRANCQPLIRKWSKSQTNLNLIAKRSPSGKLLYYEEPGTRHPAKPTDPLLYVHQNHQGEVVFANRQIREFRLVQTLRRNGDGSITTGNPSAQASHQSTFTHPYFEVGPRLALEGPSLCAGVPLLPFLSCTFLCVGLRWTP